MSSSPGKSPLPSHHRTHPSRTSATLISNIQYGSKPDTCSLGGVPGSTFIAAACCAQSRSGGDIGEGLLRTVGYIGLPLLLLGRLLRLLSWIEIVEFPARGKMLSREGAAVLGAGCRLRSLSICIPTSGTSRAAVLVATRVSDLLPFRGTVMAWGCCLGNHLAVKGLV